MKNILFVVPAFTVGGTNTSLIGMLPFIDKARYRIHVYAMNPSGPMGDEIAKYATVINQQNSDGTKRGSSLSLHNIEYLFLKVLRRCLKILGIEISPYIYKRCVKDLSKCHYDCVVAFQEGEATRFVQYFENTRKVAWVRSAYARYLEVTNTPLEEKIYNRYDLIVNVSKTAMEGFLEVMPQFKDRSIYIYNFVNKDRIRSLSKQVVDRKLNGDTFTIVSLGRVDKVKHFTEIPDIAAYLKHHGFSFRWFIIGGPTVRYPEEYDLLINKIKSNGVEDQVIILGHQPNPYPYLAHSNLLVCLSESETFNHTFAEARILNVPVLSVDYKGAEEFLSFDYGGIITSRDCIKDELAHLIADGTYYKNLKENVSLYLYDNDKQLTLLYDRVFD